MWAWSCECEYLYSIWAPAYRCDHVNVRTENQVRTSTYFSLMGVIELFQSLSPCILRETLWCNGSVFVSMHRSTMDNAMIRQDVVCVSLIDNCNCLYKKARMILKIITLSLWEMLCCFHWGYRSDREIGLLLVWPVWPRPGNFVPPWRSCLSIGSHRKIASRCKECRYLDGAADVRFSGVCMLGQEDHLTGHQRLGEV